MSRIAELNDALRQTMHPDHGTVVLTPGVRALAPDDIAALLAKVRKFAGFSRDNDPEGERDLATPEHGGIKYFAKIDYYDPSMEYGSDNPADPAKTRRVMTIMRADEY